MVDHTHHTHSTTHTHHRKHPPPNYPYYNSFLVRLTSSPLSLLAFIRHPLDMSRDANDATTYDATKRWFVQLLKAAKLMETRDLTQRSAEIVQELVKNVQLGVDSMRPAPGHPASVDFRRAMCAMRVTYQRLRTMVECCIKCISTADKEARFACAQAAAAVLGLLACYHTDPDFARTSCWSGWLATTFYGVCADLERNLSGNFLPVYNKLVQCMVNHFASDQQALANFPVADKCGVVALVPPFGEGATLRGLLS